MVVFEAIAVLLIGLSIGIVATMVDVLTIGSASFLAHFTLWVLLNAVMAVHVDSRLKAIWWAIPYNFGYVEAYFITTAASFEGYAKSLVVPLAGVALISPLLTYALWTARREKNLFGDVLAVMILVGMLVASYAINGSVGAFDVVMCVCTGLVLLVLPVRKFRITRAPRPSNAPALPAAEEPEEKYERGRTTEALARRRENRMATRPTKRPRTSGTSAASGRQKSQRYTLRDLREAMLLERREAKERAMLAREEREREERRQRVARRREARERRRLEQGQTNRGLLDGEVMEQRYREQDYLMREDPERAELVPYATEYSVGQYEGVGPYEDAGLYEGVGPYADAGSREPRRSRSGILGGSSLLRKKKRKKRRTS